MARHMILRNFKQKARPAGSRALDSPATRGQ
jgi:hypothetical protein